jgi:hypothetical protein
MRELLPRLAIASVVASLFLSSPAAAQVLPPAKKAARVKIIKAPELELSVDQLTIIRWTTNNPGGEDIHWGVVHYGTNPKDLSQTARSPVRLNQGHATTTFRVRMDNLKPQTTYYYWVSSEGGDGLGDGVKSGIQKFTTAKPGERYVGFPKGSN